MAIITLDQALQGMQYPREIIKAASGTLVAGRPHTQFYTAGIPGAGAASAAGINGEILTAPVAGQIGFTNPVSGNSYLARLQAMCTQAGSLLLIDRIWANSGVDRTLTTLQAITTPTLPARDSNGLTTGTGVFAAVEVTVGMGTGIPIITLAYTNTAGQPKTAINIVAVPASSIAGSFYPIALAAGDVGVQAITGITFSTSWGTAGALSVVLYRIIARLELTGGNVPNAIDCLTGGFPRIFDDSVLTTVFIPNTTTTSNIMGHIIVSQG